jgi:hypothetical protein
MGIEPLGAIQRVPQIVEKRFVAVAAVENATHLGFPVEGRM